MKNYHSFRISRWIHLHVIVVLVFVPSALSLDHSPQWKSSSELTYNLVNLDPQILPKSYYYCRWGNWMDRNPLNVLEANLDFTWLTHSPFGNVPNQDALDLFLHRGGKTLERIYFPTDSVWLVPGRNENTRTQGSVRFSTGVFSDVGLELYRYLHFRDRLTNEINNLPIDESLNKAVILIHGWNPNSNLDNHPENLVAQLMDQLKSANDWKFITYRWEEDADTGPAGGLDSGANGTEAVEIAHQHGQHLGQLLAGLEKIEKLHLIAHSAGSWAARAAAKHLLANNPSVRIQITLLDPFMPNAIVAIDSSLGEKIMSDIGAFNGGNRLVLLENFYSNDPGFNEFGHLPVPFWLPSHDLALGTEEEFSWRSGDVNQRVDWHSSQNGRFEHFYHSHGGPIDWYADTVVASNSGKSIPADVTSRLRATELKRYGWRRSLFFNEPVFTSQPQEQTAKVGSSVTFTVSASTRAQQKFPSDSLPDTLRYRWQKDQSDLTGATAATLTLANVSLNDAGNYRVVVTNSTGPTYSQTARLSVTTDVQPPPPPTPTFGLSLQVSPGTVVLNGKSFATLTATVTDDTGKPISNVYITFAKDGSNSGGWTENGQFIGSPNNGPTDSSGKRVAYHKPVQAGKHSFSASIDGASATGSYDAVPDPGGQVSLGVRLQSRGSGTATYYLDATVLNSSGQTVAEGKVRFSSSVGKFGDNVDGRLEAQLDDYGGATAVLNIDKSGPGRVSVEYLATGASASKDVNFSVTEAPSIQSSYRIHSQNDWEFVALKVGNKKLAAIENTKGLALYDTFTLQQEHYWNVDALGRDKHDWVLAEYLGFSKDDRVIVVGINQIVAGFDALSRSGLFYTAQMSPRTAVDLDVHPDGSQWAASLNESVVGVFNGSALLRTVENLGTAKDTAYGIAYSPDGIYLAYSKNDDTSSTRRNALVIWNTRTWSRVADVDISTGSTPRGVAWSPDSKIVAVSTGARRSIKLFNKDGSVSGLGTAEIPVSQDATGLAWSPNGKYIAAHLKDAGVTIFEASGGGEIVKCEGVTGQFKALDRIAWRNDSEVLFATGGSTEIHVFAPFDLEGPVISINSPQPDNTVGTNVVQLSGVVKDNVFVNPQSLEVSVNQGDWTKLSAGAGGRFDQTVVLGYGRNAITVRAQDLRRTSSSKTISVISNYDTNAPIVLRTNPPAGSANANVARIEVEFSVSMNQDLTARAFSLRPEVPGQISWQDNRMFFTPNQSLNPGLDYSVSVNRSAQSSAGIPLDANRNGVGGEVDDTFTYQFRVSAGPPVITAQPQSQAVSGGTAVTLKVEAIGAQPLSYQWRQNGANLAGATGAVLTIQSAAVSDEGNYTVLVSNGFGAVSSDVASLIVRTTPAITVQPISRSVSVGMTVSLVVVADGPGPLSYQWRKDGTNLTNGERIIGASAAQMSIVGVTAADAGSYTVVVSNSFASVTSSTATLTVTGSGSVGPTNVLALYLPFSGDALDMSGNGNHGTVHDATLTTDRFGNSNSAYSFNGANSFIEVPDSDRLEITNDFSLCLWIKPRQIPSDAPVVLLNKAIAGDAESKGTWLLMIANQRNKVEFSAPPYSPINAGSSGSPSVEQWSHVAFTYEKATQAWKIYLNGRQENSGQKEFSIKNNSERLLVGAHDHPASFPTPRNYFDGAIDDVRIYTRVLTPEEVLQLSGSERDRYTLTFGVNLSGRGEILAEPKPGADGKYAVGTVVELRPFSPTLTFSGWAGDVVGTGNPTTILMDRDKSVTANFIDKSTQTSLDQTQLSARRNGNEVIISWSDPTATLEEADNITGPWQAVFGGSTSPRSIPLSTNRKFYRLRK